VADTLQHRIPSADFFSWFALAEPVSVDEERLVLSFANDFAVRWVTTRFRDVLEESVQQVAGAPLRVELVSREHGEGGDEPEQAAPMVDQEPVSAVAIPHDVAPVQHFSRPATNRTVSEDELRALSEPMYAPSAQPLAVAAADAATAGSPDDGSLLLNERYRFDTFVIGEANKLAHAAALSVAEAPGQSYNPLFIYGGTGLGKTHLLHAIGHYARETRPGVKVAYVTTEEFINRFISMLQRRDGARDRFKNYFRGIDVLLMDDVQLLSGKSASLQEELFFTFNTLHEAGKQVVLTSDREPGEIPKLEERLASRFAWGLTTDIETPDRETRIAILRRKVISDGHAVPMDVLSEIGERVSSNVRELEGALTRVVGYASLTGRPIDVALAREVLASFSGADPSGGPVTIDRVQDVVCRHFDLERADLTGDRKVAKVARPRQIAMYLARVLVGESSTAVGREFGRDHSTVLYAERKIEQLLKEDREVYDLVDQLTETIRGRRASVHLSG
jgi:chromosomal replication initiator protein